MAENKIIALVGMAGSGKSEAAKILKDEGYSIIRFGEITEQILKEKGLEINEKNEKYIREELRKEHGMGAFAKLNCPRIEEALKQGKVAVDGLYSWEEYLYLRDYFDCKLVLLAIYASPKTRYERLASRKLRTLTGLESQSRDRAEIENINKGGPIAMADYTVVNDGSLDELKLKIIGVVEEVV